MQGKLLQSWWKITGTDCGTCWMKWLRWKKRLVNTHTNTHAYRDTHTPSSQQYPLRLFLSHRPQILMYWMLEGWVNKQEEKLFEARVTERKRGSRMHLYVCVRGCVCALSACIHVSPAHFFPLSPSLKWLRPHCLSLFLYSRLLSSL